MRVRVYVVVRMSICIALESREENTEWERMSEWVSMNKILNYLLSKRMLRSKTNGYLCRLSNHYLW